MSARLPQQWLDKAGEDLTVARLVFRENHMAHACFLSQQTIEKSLKAFLIAKSNKYPRSHKLIDLLNECVAIDPEYSQFTADCIRVDQYYIPTRYPDGIPGGLPSGNPSSEQAQTALAAAQTVFQFVTNHLSQDESS